MRRLSSRDRDFFDKVKRAAYANPFGDERAQLDAAIAESRADDPHVLERLSEQLTRRIDALSRESPLRARDFDEADAELVRAALLFHAFHRFLDAFERFIAREERADQPEKLGFADELFGLLLHHGIEGPEAVRMLELFYQLRRAHLFIARRLIGRGPSMQRVREELWNAVFTRDIRRYERHLWNRMEDFSTLILGETGTGKGEAASAIGRSGYIAYDTKKRSFVHPLSQSFLPLHLSEHPESLIESELFGHRKGAFTGAIEQHLGILSRVRPFGAVFLDEIGEVSPPVQVKLLRVLQERRFTPVGGHEPERFHGRVLAATHRSLDALRKEGRMREDFFYRLCASTIQIPPLRVRLSEDPGELRDLVAHLCTRIVGEEAKALEQEIAERIAHDLGPGHPFRGNVRELEQCVRRVLLTGSATPSEGALDPEQKAPASALLERDEPTAEVLVQRYCAMLYARSRNYVEVARITGLDRRTVKKHVEAV